MENVVARVVSDRLRLEDTQLLTCEEVEKLVVDYESTEGIALNAEQNRAIQMAATHAFSLVTGGAGVGKTTVLKAIYGIYDTAGVHIVQMALAGRAAKRMQEATGRTALTIAGFLRNTKPEDLARPCVVVIDEASMVDIITMSRLCELLPSHVRLLMVGDPNQLMPVGPGLVLHELAAVIAIPLVELKVVKRHGGDIAAAALAIRDGVWPDFSDIESAPICFLPCAMQAPRFGGAEAETLENTVLRLYLQDPENSQILSSRRNGVDGTRGLAEHAAAEARHAPGYAATGVEQRACQPRAHGISFGRPSSLHQEYVGLGPAERLARKTGANRGNATAAQK
jgi:exodeoxyribonuclease V alpha subunit